MIPFDFHPRTRIVFGPNALQRLGELAAELGARRALVVSDPGVIAAGHTEHGLQALRTSAIDCVLYDRVHENPTTVDVDNGVAFARQFTPDLIVGLGGGSSMDCAKGINFVYSNGGRMPDYWGVDKATKPMLPMIAVPTTAGTGSEAQSFALISDAETHVKMACGDKKAACKIAILDPTLTVTQPQRVTALTGIDAISHALETYVTKKRNEVSLAFSREAWRLLAGNFVRVLDDPNDIEARGAMQLGACFAGLAIENSMLGATHALANPLTANFEIIHGQAVALMLPHVIRYNGEQFSHWYEELLDACDHLHGHPSQTEGVETLAQFIESLVRRAGLAGRLSDCGIDETHFADLAADAAKQWTGGFNPRDLSESELDSIYQQAY